MDFRRSQQRRRQILLEEREAAPRRRRRTKAALPAPVYTDAALDENQPPITALILKWDLSFLGLLILSLATVAGLIALDAAAPGWTESLGGLDLAPLCLAGGGTLAAWLKSALLGMSLGTCLLIYQVRRFKTDDYRGTYLIWLWAAASFALAGLDCAVDLQGIARRVLVHVTQSPIHADGQVWGAIAVTTLYLPLVLRLSLEVWPSKPSLLTLLLAGGLHAAASFVGLQLPGTERFEGEAWVVGGGILLGHWFLLISLALYARYVYFDAQGLYASVRADEDLDDEDEEEDDDEEDYEEEEKAEVKKPVSTTPGVTIHRNDSGSASSAPATTYRRFDSGSTSTPAPSTTNSRRDDDDEEDDDDSDSTSSSTLGGRKLSKAERKRLRRQGKL